MEDSNENALVNADSSNNENNRDNKDLLSKKQ